jgi:hypothetical protein
MALAGVPTLWPSRQTEQGGTISTSSRSGCSSHFTPKGAAITTIASIHTVMLWYNILLVLVLRLLVRRTDGDSATFLC